MTDFLLITGPIRDLTFPPMALAQLKSISESAGFACRTIDYNQKYFSEQCNKNKEIFYDNTKMFGNTLPIPYEDIISSNCGQWLEKQIIKDINEYNPKVVGVSSFSRYNNVSCFHLCKVIKENFPHIKVITGGYGLHNPLNYLDTFDKNLIVEPEVGELLKTNKFCDTYIIGDAEHKLIEWLRDHTVDYSGVGKRVIDPNWTETAYSDFNDLDIHNYEYHKGLTLPMTSSKGCVRKCTFCDVPHNFGTFSFKKGKSVADEVIHLYETYGAKTIYFTDSLVNGSLRAFIDFVETLAELKQKKGYHDIKWTGQYIVRPSHQIPNPKNYYSLLRDSGAEGLTIGVESGSNKVLADMKKKCTVDDIYTEINYFSDHDISCGLLLFPAFPTETREDFMDTVNMMKNLQPYWCNGTINLVNFNVYYGNESYSEWGKKTEDDGMYSHPQDNALWWYRHNPDLDYKEMVFRRLVLNAIVKKLNIPTYDEFRHLTLIHNYFTTNIEKVKKFHADIRKH